MPSIRCEQPQDVGRIRDLNRTAFDSPVEADLVDRLRQQAHPFVSIVAVEGHAVVGHIAFSRMTLDAQPSIPVAGLAPMAVLPAQQRNGIGSSLVRAGLDECRRLGFVAVVVLGHAEYYPRFGFREASAFGLASEFEVPDDVFMALELVSDALAGHAGVVRYHPVFASVWRLRAGVGHRRTSAGEESPSQERRPPMAGIHCGPLDLTEVHMSGRNKARVGEFLDRVLTGGDIEATGDYFDRNLVEEVPFPGQGPGLDGLKETLIGIRTFVHRFRPCRAGADTGAQHSPS